MLGRYQVEKELGKGAMGVVYLGKDPKINRQVAIKTMMLEEGSDAAEAKAVKERFFREAETAGRLNHPNIVTIFDAGEEHDLAFIAMEFLKGKLSPEDMAQTIGNCFLQVLQLTWFCDKAKIPYEVFGFTDCHGYALKQFGLNENDLQPYLPADPDQLAEKKVEVHYLGYYLKWHPQSCYYYSVEHGGFQASPERTPGTYSKYNSIDDKMDTPVIVVKNRESGEVVRQIPSEVVIKVAHSIEDLKGLLHNQAV